MVNERSNSEKLMKWAVRASTSVALTLVVTKFIVWWQSQSVALFGSLLDSGLDLMASLVTLFAVKTAIQPPDEDHRFGHGKAEALAGLFQASIMGGLSIFLLFESGRSLYSPKAAVMAENVMGVSVLAIILSLILVMFQSYVIKKSKSIAISGDHLHYKGDLVMNLGVVLSAWLAVQGYIYADGIFGVLIAGYILHGAYDVAKPSIDMLMDKEFSEQEREDVFNITHEIDGVLGLHDLRTRTAGRDRFIQMHVEVDGNLSVHEGHFIADEVEAILGERFPDTEILIHIDPLSKRSTVLTSKEI